MTNVQFDIHPEISVVVCTYNRANYLNRCIDSVIHQTFQNWELIIVDDGSQDNTFEIVNEYIQNSNKIRYLKHRNKKQAYAKNLGIQASFGNYITFLDSDDAYKPEHLESRLKYMVDNPNIDLIQGGCYLDQEMLVVDYYQAGKTINLRDCVLGGTFFGKRQVFFTLQGFNHIAYGEDTDLWERAEKIFAVQKSDNLPETYLYSRAETSITKSFFECNAESP